MLELFAFALVAVALAAPFVVPLIWGQLEQSSQDTEPHKTSGRAAQSAAKLQPFARPLAASLRPDRRRSAVRRPLPNDPDSSA